MRRRAATASVAVAIVVACAALVGAQASPAPLAGNFTLADARSFERFSLWHAGESFAGQPLTAVYRIDDAAYPGEAIRRDDVTFVYGSCEPNGHAGCLPPLQVQNWNACERHAGVYPWPPDEKLTIAGMSAAFYEDGRRLELAAGTTTIVLYAAEPTLLRPAAGVLRKLNQAREEPCRARR
jgi:hypothetical protein